jgi:hypothetical protein
MARQGLKWNRTMNLAKPLHFSMPDDGRREKAAQNIESAEKSLGLGKLETALVAAQISVKNRENG